MNKHIENIKDYWKVNRKGYFWASIGCSLSGLFFKMIQMGRKDIPIDSTIFIVIPISFIGIFIFMWILYPIMK